MDAQTEHLLQFFGKLRAAPEHVRAMGSVHEAYRALATEMASVLPVGPEKTVALRHLLDSRHAAIRGVIAEQERWDLDPLGNMQGKPE